MILNLGDAPFKAFIRVTYPSGTCTVMLGNKSYSHSGGGTYTFTVNKKGTWTVNATSSAGLSESKNVSITYNGQVASLTLRCWDGLLYNYGNECSAVTGGWLTKGSDVAKYADHIYIISAYGAAVTTNNRIDFTGFSTLQVTCDDMWKTSVAWLLITDSNNPELLYTYPGKAKGSVRIAANGTYSIDVRNISNGHVSFGSFDQVATNVRVRNIRLI